MAKFSLLSFVLIALISPLAASAEYKLARGDTVDINVFRVPEMSGEAQLNIDGNLAIPPLGSIAAAGLSIAELEDTIRTGLADGQFLQDSTVTVSLLQVRPVVVGGDVAEPGAVQFEAGMTVRQAIALAGGTGYLREQTRGEAARLRGEQQVIEAELLRSRARLARVDAELDGVDDIHISTPEAGAAKPVRRAEVVAFEQSTANANRSNMAAQTGYFTRTRELLSDYVDELTASKTRYQSRIAAQEQEVARLREIENRGLTAQIRVAEETRRLADLVEAQSDIVASIIDAKERRERVGHDADLADLDRVSGLLSERQDTLLSVDTLTARLNALRNQVGEMGFIDGDDVTMMVFRRTEDDETGIAAEGGTRLQPGDFVEVDVLLNARRAVDNGRIEGE